MSKTNFLPMRYKCGSVELNLTVFTEVLKNMNSCLSSDTGTVIDSTAGIRKSRYERAAYFITAGYTTQIPINDTANTAINAATAQDFRPKPTTDTESEGLLPIPSNIHILVKFMPVHLRPKLSRRRHQMTARLRIGRVQVHRGKKRR